MRFLNGASQIPPAPPSLIKNERSLKLDDFALSLRNCSFFSEISPDSETRVIKTGAKILTI